MAQIHISNGVDIKSFLGLSSYYQKFVEGFSSISSSLTKLTQKKERSNGLTLARGVF